MFPASSAHPPARKRTLSLVGVVSLAASVLVAGSLATTASAAVSPGLSPVVQRSDAGVTADALPTAQIGQGVVWSEAVAGDLVYAGGSFTSARPAGVALDGPGTVTRSNLMAFSISTGVMTNFAPTLNGQVKAVAVSPDGSRVYVGGDFTQVNGVNRYRLAAFDASSGALLPWAPAVDASVKALAVAPDGTVYAGGTFNNSGNQARQRVAAFRTDGSLVLTFAPTADYNVNALVVTPDGSKVILGGGFANVNGQSALGLAAVSTTDGSLQPWAANQQVQDYGEKAAILSLTTDGSQIYGTGYVYSGTGNLEGTFSADPTTGAVKWIEDCHGDTYGVFANAAAVYSISHAHYCGNIGGFPQTATPWRLQHATAFTKDATGTIGHDPYGYHDWAGSPSPSLIDWWPDFDTGTFTGAGQAAWSITGNSNYVVMGGEFTKVNLTGQQGLVRFAVKSVAPNKQGVRVSGTTWQPTAVALTGTSVRVSFPSNWDRDDLTLTYKVIRDGKSSAPVCTFTADSTFWRLPNIGCVDTGLAPSTSHTYKVVASDPSGNSGTSNPVTVTTGDGSVTPTAYTQDVSADGASHFWRLDQAAGASTSYDWAGYDDLNLTNVAGGTAGAFANDSDTASTFDGSSSLAVDPAPLTGPNVFSEEAWFKTTSTTGGKIVGFGNATSGTSSSYDRHIYMSADGRVWFGVYNGATYTVQTSTSFNDGKWHHVVGTMDSTGPTLYVDGRRIGHNSGTSTAQPFTGYWRVGGDSNWNGNPYFNGSIDDVAIYPSSLSLTQVQQHYTDAGGSLPARPTDAYGKAVYADSPDFYYRLDDTSAATAADSSAAAANGSYSGGGQSFGASGVTGSTGTAVGFDGNGATLASAGPVAGPSVYSEELWFKTTSTSGGKLIGFGNRASGNSGSYDRHVFLDNAGHVIFGVYTGQQNLASSTGTYNDGKWHYLVATQGPDGMKLYLDSQLVGTNSQTRQESNTGYWRVGGDTGWGYSSSNYFRGTIDEVAVYSGVLSQDQISAHYYASPGVNKPPSASFTATATNLSVAVDGSGSTDSDGTIASYAWNFGDGGTATGATASHSYTTAGSYPVTLTVTDDAGATATTSRTVAVAAANVPPSAAFTATASDLSVAVDGSGSTDSDGTIASYAWDFGDGATATGATAGHTYTTGGSKRISLTVTDNRGGQDTVVHEVTVRAPNQAPTAVLAVNPTDLSVAVDGSGSADPDGTIASYAWDFGDNTAAGSGATTSHSYAKAGTYTITLTVRDNDGATASASRSVTVTPPNQAPTAAFTATPTDLSVAVDGSGSADPDGTIASYAWNFGDNSAAGSGASTSHSYAAAGTYNLTLTVTDDRGATASVTHPVTVTAPVVTTYAADQFGRTVSPKWGSADVGGAWSLVGTPGNFSVASGTGRISMAANSAAAAYLNSTSVGDSDGSVDIALDKAVAGGGAYISLAARRTDTNEYRLRAKFLATGALQLSLTKLVNNAETALATVNLTGSYTAGDVLRLRLRVTGSSTVALAGKAWLANGTEPADWQVTKSDSASPLGAGASGVAVFVSSTSVSTVASFDNFAVRSVATP